MAARIVILGAGTGGTLVANRLRRALSGDAQITVVDQDDVHMGEFYEEAAGGQIVFT